MKEIVTVKISRDNYYADKFRSYKILVDNRVIGELNSNSEFTFSVQDKSRIKLKIDWCYSNTITVDKEQIRSNNLYLKASSNIRGWKMAAVLYFITFGRKRYLTLEQSNLAI